MRRLAPFPSLPELAASVLCVALAAIVALPACASESEGYPCSQDNGNNDCDDGLQCVTPPNHSATNAPSVCCPVNLSQATTPECTVNGQIDSGSPAPPDGSTFPEAAVTEGGREATTSDAKTDTSSGGDSSSGDAGPG